MSTSQLQSNKTAVKDTLHRARFCLGDHGLRTKVHLTSITLDGQQMLIYKEQAVSSAQPRAKAVGE